MATEKTEKTEEVVAVEVDVNVPVGVPLGLQRLLPLSFVKIKQQFSVGAKYLVTSEDEELLFTARQDVSIMGMVVGDFEMDFFDENEYSVATLRRPVVSFGRPKMEVAVCGELTSVIRKEPTFFKPLLIIYDANDQPVLKIKGIYSWGCASDIKFEVLALDKTCIGRITKRAAMLRAGSLYVDFPANLDTRLKVSLIGAAVFLDIIIYVTQNQR